MNILTIAASLLILALPIPTSAQVIAVISAMPEEQRSFLESVADQEPVSGAIIKGTMHGHRIYATLSGIGKVNAAAITQELISKYQVDTILFSGVAGGISNSINIGDIVFAAATFQHDYGYVGSSFVLHAVGTIPEIGVGTGDEPIYFDLTQHWDAEVLSTIKQHITGLSESLVPVKVNGVKATPRIIMNGIVATGDQFIANESNKETLRAYRADVVEMEGAAVAQVALRNRVPIMIIRSVSDKTGGQANINFKSFFAAVAHNNSLILQTAIKALPQAVTASE